MATQEESVSVLNVPEASTGRRARPESPDDRIAFAASWEVYQMLAEAIGDQHVLLAFDGKKVELMSPGLHHEIYKEFVGSLVRAIAAQLRMPLLPTGSTRWRRPEAMRGLEADASFYFTPEKIAVAMKRPKDESLWPIPDLAVEIDTSPAQVDREEIYRALGVPEIWQFDGERLRFDVLGTDGSYADVVESRFLGLRAEEGAHLLVTVVQEAEDEPDFVRLVTEWVRAVLLPRRQGHGGGG